MRILVIVLFLFSFARADPLEGFLSAVVENNPEIKGARARMRISEYEYRMAVADFLPVVGIRYQVTSLSRVPEYSVNLPGFPRTSFKIMDERYKSFEINVRQPLFTGGRLFSNLKLREKVRDARFYEFKETVLRVITSAKKDYFSFVEASERLKIAKAYLESVRKHYRVVKSFFEEGIVPERDLLEAEYKLKRAQESVENARNLLKIARQKLEKDTGYTLKDFRAERLSFKKASFSEEELVRVAMENRPLLRKLELLVSASRWSVKLSYADFLPSLYLGLSYQRTDRYAGTGNFDFTAVSLMAEIPIFEGGKRFFRLKRARERESFAETALKEARDAVRLQVVSALSSLRSASARIKTARAMLKVAKKLLEDSEERYRERVGTSTEVVDALAYLAEARGLLNSALADYNRAIADLEYATGVSFDKLLELTGSSSR